MINPPAKKDKMILRDPTPVKIRIAAPKRHAIVEVSPIEPGIIPINDSKAEYSLEKL